MDTIAHKAPAFGLTVTSLSPTGHAYVDLPDKCSIRFYMHQHQSSHKQQIS
jgi:hypothetical protein